MVYFFDEFVSHFTAGEGADPGQEDINVSVKEEDIKAPHEKEEKAKKKRKSKPAAPRMTKEQREFAKEVHEAHVLALTASGLYMNQRCDDTLLRALVLSIIPEMHVKKAKAIRSHESFVNFFESLVVWYHGTIEVVSEAVRVAFI